MKWLFLLLGMIKDKMVTNVGWLLQMVIVVDDEDRENEGDLIMAASKVTPEAMAFIVKHGTGIVCVSMKGEDLERLQLPLMVTQKENEEKLCTAFTVSVVCGGFSFLFSCLFFGWSSKATVICFLVEVWMLVWKYELLSASFDIGLMFSEGNNFISSFQTW